MMDVYKSQKRCNRCNCVFKRSDPNPKFLTCKHFMCQPCCGTVMEGIHIKCPCGIISSLPIPDHRVFPDMITDYLPKSMQERLNNPSVIVQAPKSSNAMLPQVENSTGLNFSAALDQAASFAHLAPGDGRPGTSHQTFFPIGTPPAASFAHADGRSTLSPFQFPYDVAAADSYSHGVADGGRSTPSNILCPLDETIWRQLDSIYDVSPPPVQTDLRRMSVIVESHPFPTLTSVQPSTKQCQHQYQNLKLYCEDCGVWMCVMCALAEDHPASHILTPNSPTAHLVPSSNRVLDAIKILNDHTQAVGGFSILVRHLEPQNRKALTDFIKTVATKIEGNRDFLRDYERRNAELAAKTSTSAFAFDVDLDRPSMIFDDYFALKNILEKMLDEVQRKNGETGTSCLLKVASALIYQFFRVSLRGEAGVIVEKRVTTTSDAATNTVKVHKDAYDGWLSTLKQRADLAKKITDPAAIIPPGWFVKTLPNVFFIEFSFIGPVVPTLIGRVLIETNPDVAPVMSANFALLCDKSRKLSYNECVVFQCWRNESIITGDNETKTGTGGKSVLNGDFVVPDDSGLPSFKGAVGMRRLKKRISRAGEISSQFRIMLQDLKGITGIFGRVVSGIDIVEKIASYGDKNGNPTKVIMISDCGKI